MPGFYGIIVSVILVGSILPAPTQGWTITAETSLKSSLLSGYQSIVRPEETVQVLVGFQMTAIDKLSIKDQVFSVTGWWELKWSDGRLGWTPSSHSNIEEIRFSPKVVWTPSLVVTNDVVSLSAIREHTIPVRVDFNGTAHWSPPGIAKLNCEMDASKFPFDDHTCNIQLTSAGYTLDELVCNQSRGLEMNYYQDNGEWEVRDVWHSFEDYTDSGFQYFRLTFYLRLHRMNEYYWLNLIVPIMLSSMLNIFVFALPVDSGEKMGYALTCLLTFVVLLTLIAQDIPTSAKHINIIEVYLSIVLILSGVSVVLSILSIKYYNMSPDHHIPPPVQSLVSRCWPWVDHRKDGEDTGGGHDVHSSKLDEVMRDAQTPDEGCDGHVPTPKQSETTMAFSNRYDARLVTGKVISKVMDAVMLRLFATFVSLLTFIIMVVIIT